MPEIIFDEAEHRYTVDGVVRMSVTQILKSVGLIDDSWYSDFARDRGKAVHAACHYLDENDLAPETVGRDLEGYLAAWERFKFEARVQIELREHRVYHPVHGYAGTLDRTARLNGLPSAWVLDLKTGQPEDWHALQLAAYTATFEKPGALRRMAVYLRADGSYATREFSAGEFLIDLHDFLAAVRVCGCMQRRGIHGNNGSRSVNAA